MLRILSGNASAADEDADDDDEEEEYDEFAAECGCGCCCGGGGGGRRAAWSSGSAKSAGLCRMPCADMMPSTHEHTMLPAVNDCRGKEDADAEEAEDDDEDEDIDDSSPLLWRNAPRYGDKARRMSSACHTSPFRMMGMRSCARRRAINTQSANTSSRSWRWRP